MIGRTSLILFTKAFSKQMNAFPAISNHRHLRRLPSQVSPKFNDYTNNIIDNCDNNIENESSNSIEVQNNTNFKMEILNRTNDDITLEEAKKQPYLPSFNLAAYVNKSETLQQLVKLGVDLHRIEKRKGLGEFVLRLDFESNIQPYLLFLQDQGIPASAYGELITKNPLLFKVSLDDLLVRVTYLEAKRFAAAQIQRILVKNPFWLMFSTRRIDQRLGHFQGEFNLSGDDVRYLASKQPRLITYNMEQVRMATFAIREEMGFDKDEIKCLLLHKPRLWMLQSDELVERFAYAHNVMGLSHDQLLQNPHVLSSRLYRLQQRHEFLKALKRAQYDPLKDLYVSPRKLVEGTDFYFARNIAKSDLETFELFLKTR